MKPRPPLGRLRPLVPRTKRRGAMRATRGLSLVWRARRQRQRPDVSLLRAFSTNVVQSFPLSLALSWLAPPRPDAKARPKPMILHRDRLRLLQPPMAPSGRFERLVKRITERTYDLTRREVERIVRLRDLASVECTSAARMRSGAHTQRVARASASADSPVVAPKRARRPLPGILAPAPPRTPRAVRQAAPPPRRTARSILSRIAVAASAARLREVDSRRSAPRESLPLVRHAPKQGPEAGRTEKRLRQPRSARPEAAPRRPAVDLVWTRVAGADAAGSGAAASAALVQPAGLAHPPQAWSAASGPRAAAAPAPAPAAMPDMNRLVDEVVRRLDRIARDERMRRGI